MVPTAPTFPTQASVAADPIGRNSQLGLFTNFVNLLGWSALALPAAFVAGGLPFGVTFIGPAGADAAPFGPADVARSLSSRPRMPVSLSASRSLCRIWASVHSGTHFFE